MRTIAIFSIAGLALLAACNDQPAAETNTAATSNEVVQSAETETAGLGTPVDAETARKLMHDRHENYEKIGDSMKVVSRELKSDTPDLAKVRAGAETIATLAPQIPSWFPPGTGPDVGKTHAKAIIWDQPDDFKAKADALDKAATAFQAAARGGNLEAIRGAHGELGKTCKSCHDTYREKD